MPASYLLVSHPVTPHGSQVHAGTQSQDLHLSANKEVESLSWFAGNSLKSTVEALPPPTPITDLTVISQGKKLS